MSTQVSREDYEKTLELMANKRFLQGLYARADIDVASKLAKAIVVSLPELRKVDIIVGLLLVVQTLLVEARQRLREEGSPDVRGDLEGFPYFS